MTTQTRALEFPPLLTGIAVSGDPFQAALASVKDEVEPGAVFYGSDLARFQTAIVLAPEEPLRSALRVSFAISLGLNDALGALAPPEVGVHLAWPNRIKVNGALCGTLTAAASTTDASAEPDWLIIGLDMPLMAAQSDEPGHTPDQTTLFDEGCSDIALPDLIEAWGRHMMSWLHIYLTDGFEELHRAWLAVSDDRQYDYFVGLDEHGGLLVKSGDRTELKPLTALLSNGA